MLIKSYITYITSLQQKKFRDQYGVYLVEGVKGCEEAVAAGAKIKYIVADMDSAHDNKNLFPKGTPVLTATESDVRKIKTTETFPGILTIVEKEDRDFDFEAPVVCLDGVQDPGNVGTIIRTCDWFGVPNILLSEGCVDPYNPKVVRSTMGSIFRTNIRESDDVIADLEVLREKGYAIVSLTLGLQSIDEMPKNPKTVYVFGSESHGVREEIVSQSESYTIPGRGGAESLNVGVAVGVVLSKI